MDDQMKDEYDFTEGVRGKFYREGTRLELPVYLDEDVLARVKEIAEEQKTDLSTVVNEFLRKDVGSLESH